jgi:hypothetical protein
LPRCLQTDGTIPSSQRSARARPSSGSERPPAGRLGGRGRGRSSRRSQCRAVRRSPTRRSRQRSGRRAAAAWAGGGSSRAALVAARPATAVAHRPHHRARASGRALAISASGPQLNHPARRIRLFMVSAFLNSALTCSQSSALQRVCSIRRSTRLMRRRQGCQRRASVSFTSLYPSGSAMSGRPMRQIAHCEITSVLGKARTAGASAISDQATRSRHRRRFDVERMGPPQLPGRRRGA